MKKILFAAGCLLCILLAACGKEQQDPDMGETDATAAEKEADFQKETEAESQENAEVISSDSALTIYKKEGIQLVLQASLSPDTYRTCYVLKAVNDTDQKLTLAAMNWVINHTLFLGETSVFYIEPNSEMNDVLEEVTAAVHLDDQTDIQSIQCQITVKDENYELLDETEISVDLDKPLVAAVIYDTFMDARAEAQVLLEDEKVRVTLDGWGKSPDSSYVRGVLHFENLSDTQIPVVVNGMAVNDIFMEISDALNDLAPGDSCYTICSIPTSQFTEEGISSISKVSLMILTDESQNTGSVTYGGGNWYPVTLAEKGDESNLFTTGEPLDGTTTVQISLVSQEQSEWTSGGGVYKWKLAVVNDSEENIEIAIVDVLLDGVSEEEWRGEDSDRSIYVSNNEVGAHSNRYVFLNAGYGEGTDRPDLSFKIQIQSMAGGSVIYTGENVITISAEE